MAVQIAPKLRGEGRGAAGSSELLKVEVRKGFSGADGFLLDVRFEIPPGIAILFGPSGAGKTTLLECIAGLMPSDAGRVAIGDRVLFDSAQGLNVPARRRGIGYVFQTLALFPHLTVDGNIQYGLSRMDRGERERRSAGICESFRIAHLRGRRPGEISGGERQRVALARALVTEPAVLLLDEPLAALDLTTKSRIVADLRAWNAARHIPVLYVTHSRDEVFALGERVLVLQQGRVLAEGTPHQVLDAPRHETVAQLAGFENVFDTQVTATHEAQGTMTCRLEGGSALEAPLTRVAAGGRVRVGVRAGDILLATAPPHGLSARNVLPGKLTRLVQTDVTVIARVDCGTEFEVHLTPGARDHLGLQIGMQVWLVIKTYSCHLLLPAD